MSKLRRLLILAVLCFVETGFIVNFSRQDLANKIASIPFILIFGYLIFILIMSFQVKKEKKKKKRYNFLDLDEKNKK